VITEQEMALTLRRAVKHAGSGWASQPSRLRLSLEQVLGDEARAHRTQIHQLVVAAEERIPARLSAAGDDSSALGRELAYGLASTRGWTVDAAAWAVRTWAASLGTPLDPFDVDDVIANPPPVLRTGERPVVAPTVLPDSAVPPTQLPPPPPPAPAPPVPAPQAPFGPAPQAPFGPAPQAPFVPSAHARPGPLGRALLSGRLSRRGTAAAVTEATTQLRQPVEAAFPVRSRFLTVTSVLAFADDHLWVLDGSPPIARPMSDMVKAGRGLLPGVRIDGTRYRFLPPTTKAGRMIVRELAQ
jgi:hypothetical protein